MYDVKRILKLANAAVAGISALLLHLFRVGVVVFAAQAQVPQQSQYYDNPLDRMEKHLEHNDSRLDDLDKTVSHLEGGAEVAFSGIVILNILGFIKFPKVEKKEEG